MRIYSDVFRAYFKQACIGWCCMTLDSFNQLWRSVSQCCGSVYVSDVGIELGMPLSMQKLHTPWVVDTPTGARALGFKWVASLYNVSETVKSIAEDGALTASKCKWKHGSHVCFTMYLCSYIKCLQKTQQIQYYHPRMQSYTHRELRSLYTMELTSE